MTIKRTSFTNDSSNDILCLREYFMGSHYYKRTNTWLQDMVKILNVDWPRHLNFQNLSWSRTPILFIYPIHFIHCFTFTCPVLSAPPKGQTFQTSRVWRESMEKKKFDPTLKETKRNLFFLQLLPRAFKLFSKFFRDKT